MNDMFLYRLGQKRGGGSSGGGITPSGELAITENGTYDVTKYASASVNVASGGGGAEAIPITADNIENYFEVEMSGFSFYSEHNSFSVTGGASEGYEDENGDWVEGEWIGAGHLTLTPVKNVTFFVNVGMELTGEGAWYSVCKGTHPYFDSTTSSDGIVVHIPLCIELEAGTPFIFDVELFEEGDYASVAYMSVIPK